MVWFLIKDVTHSSSCDYKHINSIMNLTYSLAKLEKIFHNLFFGYRNVQWSIIVLCMINVILVTQSS